MVNKSPAHPSCVARDLLRFGRRQKNPDLMLGKPGKFDCILLLKSEMENVIANLSFEKRQNMQLLRTDKASKFNILSKQI